jgi:hypothetical protein
MANNILKNKRNEMTLACKIISIDLFKSTKRDQERLVFEYHPYFD